ncbi:MAG TPA: hypothetical protein IAC12_03835 [Candidatus Aphodovivens avistercoris]|nr:hypothetical protein [Candidatus Aphodovivens avistercoris]
MRLTEPIRRRNGRLVADVEGHEAYSDAVAALRLLEITGEEAAPADKTWVAWRVVFVDAESASKDGPGLLARAAWELYGIDLDGSHASECGGKRVIDWEADAQRIAASVRQVYGVTWEQFARETAFRDACAMIGMLPRDTPMGTAIHYRTAKAPRFNGKNGEQVAAFKRAQRAFAIDGGGDPAKASNDAMADFAASMMRAVGSV